tara:strand:- start:944 stop:1111 length:168 start_codon:yes stop_codon:yes gene_type:complete
MGIVLSVAFAWFQMETMMLSTYITRLDVIVVFMAGLLASLLVCALMTLFDLLEDN